MKTASQRGKANRLKGQVWQRKVAKLLAFIWPDARSNISQTRSAAKEGGDILGTPFYIEAKCGASVDVKAAWRQAERDRGDGEAPIVLFVREHRRKPFVVMSLKVIDGFSPRSALARVDLSEFVRVWLEARA